MRTTTTIAFTLLASLLVVTAAPVQASSHDDVASIHTTPSDFNAASALDNVEVSGSGTSSSVDLEARPVVDDFEDGDASSTLGSDWGSWSGDTGSFSATSNALNGSYSGLMSPGTNVRSVSTTRSSATTEDILWVWNGEQGSDFFSHHSFRVFSSGTRILRVAFHMDSDVRVNGNSVGSWTGNTTYRMRASFDFENDEVEVFRDETSLGTFDLESAASSYDEFDYVIDNNEHSTEYTGRIDDIQTIADPAEGQYVSAAHDAEQVEQAFIDLSLSDVTTTVEWQYHDGTNWQVADTSTYTTSGNKTVDVSGHSSASQWRVNVSYSWAVGDSDSATASIADEGVLFEASAPEANDSTMDPSGGEAVTSDPVTLSLDVEDSDFATTQGDDLTVDFYLDGSQVSTDILTSNGTAEHELSSISGGSHTWHAEVEDSYGETTTSATESFDAPGELTVYNESDPDQTVDTVDVTIRFFDNEDMIVEKSTSNGVVDMSGLPADEEFVVEISASSHYDRRVVIDSLFSQQRVYLLPDSEPAVYNRFKLLDKTGQYPATSTRLIIERPLNVSGNLEWERIAGDFFGANNEFPVDLHQDERYRLKIRNDQGNVRVLGSYYATDEDNPKTLDVGTVNITTPSDRSWGVESELVDPDADRKLRFSYLDDANETSELCVRVHERGNTSNELQQDCATDVHQYSILVDLPDDNSQWVANWTATRNGEAVSQIQAHGGKSTIDMPLGPPWKGVFSMILIMFTATLSVAGGATRGAIATVFVAGILMAAGWIDVFLPFWMVAGTIAIGGHLRIHGVRL